MIVTRLGRVDYATALAHQEDARDSVRAGGDDLLLLLEHPPVVTLGRRGGVVDRRSLARLATPIVETDRGGLATWHGPGQLVGYPIVNLGRARLTVPDFVAGLGALMLGICARLGLGGVAYDACRPGVYRAGKKLGSIGLHVRRGVTTHGFALNICNDLTGFQAIVPCGDAELQVSTVARELDRSVALDEAMNLADELAGALLSRPSAPACP